MKRIRGFATFLVVALGVSCIHIQPAFAQAVTGTTRKNITITDNSGATKKSAPADGFAIQIKGGKATPAKAKKGVKVTLQATVPAGMEFDFWASNSDLDFADRTKSSTTFTMPGHAIVVTPHFKEIIPSNSSSNVIVASSYAATFKIEDSKFSTAKNLDKSISSILVIPTTISRIGGNIQGNVTAADINECIANGKKALEENPSITNLKVDVKLPVSDDCHQIKVNFTPEVWESLAIENVTEFSVSTKEGSVAFNSGAIHALNSQLTANNSLIFLKKDKNTIADHVSYQVNMRFDGTDSRGTDLVTLPTTGIKATIPYQLDDEKKASKVQIMGTSETALPAKVAGASYNKTLKAVIIPLTTYDSYDISIAIK